jgi:hypothetical protein
VAERVLTQRELNRTTLLRQLLLRRARVPVVRAVERVAGLQAQLGTTPYVGLWSRVEGFRRKQLERALLAGKVTRGVLMRGTVHLVTAADYGLFASAIEVAPAGWVRPDDDELARTIVPSLRSFCAEPRTRGEIDEWLGREHGVRVEGPNGLWYALRVHGRIAHAPESSLWSSPIQRPRFVAVEVPTPEGEAARAELVRRYLAAFGPATRAEIAGWSGMKVRDFAHLLDGLLVLRDDGGRQLLDLPRAVRPAGDVHAPVRFLPKFDNVLLDRARVLPDDYRKLIVRKNADVQPTFTADGYVAGIWRVEKGRVATEAFAPLPRAARRELEDERTRLEAWLR